MTERTIDAVAAGWSGQFGAHSGQASWRHDRNSQYGHENTVNLGYAFAVAPGWRLGAAGGTSFNAPSFNQLYWPGFGNPALQPEEGKQAELSLRYEQGVHRAGLQVYEQRMRGYITAGPAPTNVPRARFRGVSLSYDGRLAGWDLTGALDWTDPRNVTENVANHDRLLPRRAQRSLKAGAHRDFGAWTAGATFTAFSHRFDDAANQTRLPGYGTLDLRADWRFAADWTLQARLNNLADRRYETALGYNQPGREAYLTLRWQPR